MAKNRGSRGPARNKAKTARGNKSGRKPDNTKRPAVKERPGPGLGTRAASFVKRFPLFFPWQRRK